MNCAAVVALQMDADNYLAFSDVEVRPGPATLEMVVNLCAGYINLSNRSLQLTMADDQLVGFLHKIDRMRAKLLFFGQCV